MNIELIKQFIELDNQRKSLEENVDKIKEQMNAIEQTIIDEMIFEQIDSVKVNGFTIGPKRHIFAFICDGDKERAILALKNSGYGHYVTEAYNTRSLSKLVEELIETDGKLPDEFDGAIGKFEKYKLNKRKSS